jgi:hypothetical protein
MYRSLAENGDASDHPTFEQMVLSIATAQLARMKRLETKLNERFPPEIKLPTEKRQLQPDARAMVSFKPAPRRIQRGLSDFG